MKHRYLTTLLGMSLLSAAGCAVKSSSPVVLNEILPSNSMGCADEVNERNDWVELYNNGDDPVDLGGYSLTDDTASPRKSVIPAGVIIESQSVARFWADGTPEQGKTHLSLKLNSLGEGVTLYDPEEKQIDQYRWTNANSDVSFARVPDGTGKFEPCSPPTCDKPNGSSCGN